jgi:acetylglutamate kinase
MNLDSTDVRRPLDPNEVVLRFLESIGKRSEAEFYLDLFVREDKQRFATLVIDAPVIADALDAVGLDLRFLGALGLTPVVCVGLFDAASQNAQAKQLHQALGRVGLGAQTLVHSDTEAIAACVHRGFVPIVLLGEARVDATAGSHVDDEDSRALALQTLVQRLGTRKLLFLQRRGGLRRSGKAVPQLTLTASIAALTQIYALSDKQRAIVGIAQALLRLCERPQLTIAITSPLQLLRELFTVKGAGTLLRRGARITRYDAFDKLDAPRLRDLLQSAFERPIAQAFFAQPPQAIYVDEDYQAAAITQKTALGAYLSKFAVGRRAQGEGLGGDLWQIVTQDNAQLFWRSRRNNPIDPWYVKQCEAMIRRPVWNIFVRGLGPEALPAAVRFAESAPLDFL